MPYVLLSDLELAAGGAERLRQLADFDGTGVASATAIASVIAEAEAMVNKAVNFRYGVPLADPVPLAIKSLVAREAIFLLKLSRDMVTEADQLAHEERLKATQDIAEGRATLGVTIAPPKSSHVVDRVSGQDELAPVSRESLKGFA